MNASDLFMNWKWSTNDLQNLFICQLIRRNSKEASEIKNFRFQLEFMWRPKY